MTRPWRLCTFGQVVGKIDSVELEDIILLGNLDTGKAKEGWKPVNNMKKVVVLPLWKLPFR